MHGVCFSNGRYYSFFPSSFYFYLFSRSWEQDKGICSGSPDTTMRSLGSAAAVLRNRLSALPRLPQLPAPRPSFRWRWSTGQSTVWHAERGEGLIGLHKLWLYRNFDVLWNRSWVRTAGKEEVQKITVFCASSCNITDITWAKSDECLSSHMLNAWWAMLHISPSLFSSYVFVSSHFHRVPPPPFDKVGTFWMSTGTVLIRTPYDALTVKITRSALHVWSNSFSSPALSRAFTHSKARYGVSRDLIAPAFEGFGCISVQTEVVWKGEKSPSVSLRLVRAKKQNKNQNKNQIKQGLWWKFQQVAINHHTSTMHSNISAVSLWKRYDW